VMLDLEDSVAPDMHHPQPRRYRAPGTGRPATRVMGATSVKQETVRDHNGFDLYRQVDAGL
jgi:hypothetical protein